MRRYFLLMIVLFISACGGGSENPPPATDYSGDYHLILSGSPVWTMGLTQTGSDAAAVISGEGMNINASGTVSGNTVELEAGIPEMGTMSLSVNFADDGQSFVGSFSFSPPGYMSGTLMGQVADWPAYDLSAGLPKFIEDEYIGMTNMASISRFRSGEGHDFSDDFETCRSMKHYYVPDALFSPWTSIPVYSPASAKVVGYDLEYHGSSPVGYKLALESTIYPGIYFNIFHMTPDAIPPLGQTYAAGELIGTHGSDTITSDMAVGIYNTGSNWVLVSFFDVMTDAFFTSNYITPNAAISNRADLIISRAARDADPLTCSGEIFITNSSTADYVDLGL